MFASVPDEPVLLMLTLTLVNELDVGVAVVALDLAVSPNPPLSTVTTPVW
jgi:hypothetical protein